MDGKEYLEQIASTARPTKKTKMSGVISSPYFKILLVTVVAFIVIVIVGSLISGSKVSLSKQIVSLKMQVDGTMAVIFDYQTNLKSSDLRSSSSSLYGVLSITSSDLQNYLQEKYDSSEKEYKNLQEEADLEKDALEADLFNAKINGTLDRIYAYKMTYQISAIMAKETSIYNTSGDETLKSLLETSYNSLNNLYEKFSNFSETK